MLAFAALFVLSEGAEERVKIQDVCEAECEPRQEDESYPYVYHVEDFDTVFKSEEGLVKVLPKFTQRSDLFREIENIRMLVLEASPHSFVMPSYWDSDVVFFVSQGRGTITLVDDIVKSFNIERGHLMTVPAGVTFYMINRDDHETLVLYGFAVTLAVPGQFAPFFGVGSQDPESFYHVFSPEILETLFNTSSDKVLKLFSQQKKGVIISASKAQIKGLTAEDTNQSDYCKEEYGPCQLLSHNTEDTEFGKIYMVFPKDYVKYQELNMYTSFSITTKGCMNSPLYSTRVTKVIVVVNGRGRFEMASPVYEEGSTRIRYRKITAELRPGMAIVIPPGHLLVLTASQDENLENINYEFIAKGNYKYLYAGRNNVLKRFQKEAKELAFGISAEEVDEVLDRQTLDFFMKGPIRVQPSDTAAL
ncbi:hypothetical protein vseg_003204 [Gypsophila vaccaria]